MFTNCFRHFTSSKPLYRLFCSSLFLSFFFGIIQLNILAQKQLTVLDKETEQAIPNVFIYNTSQTFYEVTDKYGLIDLPECEDEEVFIVQHQNYIKSTLKCKELQNFSYKILLEKSTIELPTVEVLIPASIYDSKENISKKIEKIDQKKILEIAPQNSADLLESKSGVYVQKSQAGGGSPVIRGVEANKLLIMIDDVRMNNAIYRGGHLQNILTIDPLSLASVSLIYGPGSVLYGSDALGGVMLFRTKNPTFSNDKKLKATGVLSSKYLSGNKGQNFHGNLSIGNQKLAVLGSLSLNKFGTLRIGQNSTKDFPDWGYQQEHIETYNNRDTVIQNDRRYEIFNTAYKQVDYFGKMSWKMNATEVFYVNVQGSTSSNIQRNDKLNDYQDGNLRWAEWNYGPQKRQLYSLNFKSWKKRSLSDYFSAIVSFQKIEESRIKRRYKREWRNHQIEQVAVWASNINASKKLNSNNNIFYGFESNYNQVNSSAFDENIITKEKDFNVLTRYPSRENHTFSLGLYAKWRHRINENWALNLGSRITFISLEANFEPSNLIELPFEQIAYNKSAFNYTAGIVRKHKSTTFSATLSSGFRAPNLDDVSKIFSPQNGIVVLPNTNVKPEYTYNLDMQFSSKIKFFEYGLDLFGTFYQNLIKRQKTVFGDQDSILFEGEMNEIYTNTNAEKAMIFGGSFFVKCNMGQRLELFSQLSYTVGRDISNKAPLGHIPPLYGKTELAFIPNQSLKFLLEAEYNFNKSIENYSPFREDKDDEATIVGTPAYLLLNTRVNYSFKENWSFHFAIENILDQHYKKFASGISGMGRSFNLGVQYIF